MIYISGSRARNHRIDICPASYCFNDSIELSHVKIHSVLRKLSVFCLQYQEQERASIDFPFWTSPSLFGNAPSSLCILFVWSSLLVKEPHLLLVKVRRGAGLFVCYYGGVSPFLFFVVMLTRHLCAGRVLFLFPWIKGSFTYSMGCVDVISCLRKF